MKDKPILDTTSPVPENQSSQDGLYPEQQPRKFPTLEELIRSLGCVPTRMSDYMEAFTHASYVGENSNSRSYDRWEFLGDGVLDLVVGDLLFKQYPTWPSGKMSKTRASIVEGKNLCDTAVKLGFAPYVRFSTGEKKNAAYHGHIFEDVFESFIGVYYSQEGYAKVYDFIARTMDPYIKGEELAGEKDWKSLLQEEIQKEFKSGVQYQIVSETGDAADKSFTAICMVDGVILGTGTGHNKKQAMTQAAKEALLSRRR